MQFHMVTGCCCIDGGARVNMTCEMTDVFYIVGDGCVMKTLHFGTAELLTRAVTVKGDCVERVL